METAGTRGTITATEDEAATDIAIEARRELLLLLLLLLPTSSLLLDFFWCCAFLLNKIPLSDTWKILALLLVAALIFRNPTQWCS